MVVSLYYVYNCISFFLSVFTSSQVVRLKTIHSICVSSKYGKVASNAEKLLSRHYYHSEKFINFLFLSLSHEVIDLQLVVLQAVHAVLNFEQKHFIRNMHICEKAQIKKNPVVPKSDVI